MPPGNWTDPSPTRSTATAVLDYYQQQVIPRLQNKLGKELKAEEFEPQGALPFYLQYQYILRNPHPEGQKDLLDKAEDTSEYAAVHARFHPMLTRFRDTLGFRDLYLVDPETGRIIYTVSKEADLGTSLYRGPYRLSGLANVVSRCKRALGPGDVCIEDFSSYTASNGAPTAFAASAVFSEGKIVAVIAVQISIDELNRILTSNQAWEEEGLGRTGETYIAGPDFLMRSDSRFLLEDPTAYYDGPEECRHACRRDRPHPALRNHHHGPGGAKFGRTARLGRQIGRRAADRLSGARDLRRLYAPESGGRSLGAGVQDRPRRGPGARLRASAQASAVGLLHSVDHSRRRRRAHQWHPAPGHGSGSRLPQSGNRETWTSPFRSATTTRWAC